MKGRQILARGGPVHLPPPLALVHGYPTIAEAERRYLVTLAYLSPRTRDTYRNSMRRFDHFLAAASIDPFTQTAEALRDDVLEWFFRWLIEAGYRRATIDTYLGGVKSFWRFATARKLVPPTFSYDAMRNGLRETMGRPASYRSPRVDYAGLVALILHVDRLPLPHYRTRKGAARLELLRDRALIHVLYATGARRAEVVGLNRRDAQEGHATSALILGKGGKERWIYFDQDALEAIRAYLAARTDTHAPLFLRHDNHRPRDPGPMGEKWRLEPQSAWGIVRRYGRAVGVDAHPHHFRHLKAWVLLNHAASLSEVQDILGHASPETTKRVYAHYTPGTLRAAFDRSSRRVADLAAELEAEADARRGSPIA